MLSGSRSTGFATNESREEHAVVACPKSCGVLPAMLGQGNTASSEAVFGLCLGLCANCGSLAATLSKFFGQLGR